MTQPRRERIMGKQASKSMSLLIVLLDKCTLTVRMESTGLEQIEGAVKSPGS